MMLLSWFIVLLCISANTGDVLLLRKPGENVTMQCSFAKCVSSIDGCVGMYLYHGLYPQEEVLYYHSSGYEKITPRIRYSKRVEKSGSLRNHTITISNLVVEDSGLYRCDYKRTAETDVKCTSYILVVSAPTSRPEEEHSPHVEEKCSPLVLVVVATCSISIFATIIFILLFLKLKQWTTSRRRARSVPIECVYEVMTKNRIVPEAAPETYSSISLPATA